MRSTGELARIRPPRPVNTDVRRLGTSQQHNGVMRQPLAKAKDNSETPGTTAATVGYEARLWQMADALRGSMDAAEYKHVCLGPLFLKYISDAFEAQHAQLEAEQT